MVKGFVPLIEGRLGTARLKSCRKRCKMLSFSNVTVARGLSVLVQGASLTLPAGAFWCLRGGNGTGKTTLLRAAAGLVEPLSGTVKSEAALSYLGHDLGLKSLLPVSHYKVDYAAWDLEALCDLPISALSAGQKKRVALARSLDSAKPLWLLDEPLANLDPAYEERVLTAIAGHCAAGGAVLATAHKAVTCDQTLEIRGRKLEVAHG